MEYQLGIDVMTKDANKLIRKLRALKSTFDVCHGGEYHEDRNYSQVHIRTSMDENALDNWLWRVNHGADYVGVFTLKNEE